jgi:hypothetical protein
LQTDAAVPGHDVSKVARTKKVNHDFSSTPKTETVLMLE